MKFDLHNFNLKNLAESKLFSMKTQTCLFSTCLFLSSTKILLEMAVTTNNDALYSNTTKPIINLLLKLNHLYRSVNSVTLKPTLANFYHYIVVSVGSLLKWVGST